MIGQTDPKAGYLAQQADIDAAVRAVLDSGWYILGEQVKAFEAEFAAYIGVGHTIGAASGTDALELALRAWGIGPGDVVLTVSHTAVATVAAIERCGAMPAVVDIDAGTYCMDPAALPGAVARCEGRARAVVAVHLYGQPAAMGAIRQIADEHDLCVIEDAAQAHGAAIDGQKVGRWGHMGAFSFYPTKNLAAVGDGGAVVTDDDALAKRLRSLREYGWQQRYISAEPGINSRLDEMQAAILRVRLRQLDADNNRRREIARRYDQLLAGTAFELPRADDNVRHVFHQYVVRSERRDELRAFLRQRGVATGVHYPAALHQQPAYADRLAGVGPLKVTEQVVEQIVSLPMYPQLTDDQVDQVAAELNGWPGSSRARPSDTRRPHPSAA